MALLLRRLTVPMFTDYRKYKRYLREEFGFCCVYCTIHENENGGPRNFHVEHYRPKALFPHLITQYHNLLYACAICNSYKVDDWPSDDPLTDNVGYLDPCEHDYDKHFCMTASFEIKSSSGAAQYMIERLHLNRCQLKKIRKLRQQVDTVHRKVVELNNTLAEIEQLLEHDIVSERLQASFQQFITGAREQYASEIHMWETRWEPEIDIDDYS